MVRSAYLFLWLFALPTLALAFPAFALFRWILLLFLMLPAFLFGVQSRVLVALTWLFGIPLLIPMIPQVGILSLISFFIAAFGFSTFPYLLAFYYDHEKNQMWAKVLTQYLLKPAELHAVIAGLFPGVRVRYTRLVQSEREKPFSFSGSLLALPYRQGALVMAREVPFTEEEKVLLRQVVRQVEQEKRHRAILEMKAKAARNLQAMFSRFQEAYLVYNADRQTVVQLVPAQWLEKPFLWPKDLVLERIPLEAQGFCLRIFEPIIDSKAPFARAFLYCAHEMKTALTSLLFLLDQRQPDQELVRKEWDRVWWFLTQKTFTQDRELTRVGKDEIERLARFSLGERVRFSWEGKAFFYTYPAALFTLLNNLLQNAAYHSSPDVPLDFRCFCHAEKLIVKAENEKSLHLSSSSFLAHGLGMEIMRRLTDDLGGKLNFQQKGKRVLCCLEIPVRGSDAIQQTES